MAPVLSLVMFDKLQLWGRELVPQKQELSRLCGNLYIFVISLVDGISAAEESYALGWEERMPTIILLWLFFIIHF